MNVEVNRAETAAPAALPLHSRWPFHSRSSACILFPDFGSWHEKGSVEMTTDHCDISHWHADYNRRVVGRQRLAISKIQRMKERGEPFEKEKQLPSTGNLLAQLITCHKREQKGGYCKTYWRKRFGKRRRKRMRAKAGKGGRWLVRWVSSSR